MTALSSNRPAETIVLRANPFMHLEDDIAALRSMVSINEFMVEHALDRDRFLEAVAGMHLIPFSPDLVRDLKFSAADLLKRISSIAEQIDMLSAEAFDDQG